MEDKTKQQISVRLERDLVRRAEREAARRIERREQNANRNAVIEDALRSFLGLLRGGAYFPTDEEKGVMDSMRRLLSKKPDAVEALRVLVYLCERSEGMAEAVTQIASGLETVQLAGSRSAQGLPELPEPEHLTLSASEQKAISGEKRRKR